jgi:hypothetical protein
LELKKIEEEGCLPNPTYKVYVNGAVASDVRVNGLPAGPYQSYFTAPVVWWMKRASMQLLNGAAGNLEQALKSWIKLDLRRALETHSDDAKMFGWRKLFDHEGKLLEDSLNAEIEAVWQDWMKGGWAVCLRRFDGYHLATKEIERARILALTDSGKRAKLTPHERLILLDAIERLDAVMLPFAPHERPHGTPGLLIDANVARYNLPGGILAAPVEYREAC